MGISKSVAASWVISTRLTERYAFTLLYENSSRPTTPPSATTWALQKTAVLAAGALGVALFEKPNARRLRMSGGLTSSPPSAWRLPLMRQGWGFLRSYAANRTVSSAGSCFIEAGSVLAFRPSPELTSLQANTRCPRANTLSAPTTSAWFS